MDRPPLRERQLRLRALIAGTDDVSVADLDRAAATLGIRGDARLSAGARVAIYRGMYFLRLRDALAQDFIALQRALGDERFDDLVRRYLAVHPSDRPSLRDLGRHLPRFLHTTATDPSDRWQHDLAALEWAMVEAFDAPDQVALGEQHLAALAPEDWPQLRLEPVASLALLACATPADELRDRVLADDPADTTVPAPRPDPSGTEIRIRVWRQDTTVFHRRMDSLEAEALASLDGGRTFAELCAWLEEHAGDEDEDVARTALRLLRRWLDDGLLIAPR